MWLINSECVGKKILTKIFYCMSFSITNPNLELYLSIQGKKPTLVRLIMTRHIKDRSPPDKELCCYENTPLLLKQ
jgi:hypothetical protein